MLMFWSHKMLTMFNSVTQQQELELKDTGAKSKIIM